MKKIFFFSEGFVSGGAERVISTVASGLSKRGYNVSVILKTKAKTLL
jgi:hypothetical protein